MSAQPDPAPAATAAGPASDPGARSNIEPRLVYDDLRQWLEQARKLGEVKEVSELTWEQDIGVVAGVATHDDSAPCFVFGEVPGTIKGSRVLVNFFGGKRKNMTLGFPTALSKLDLSEGVRTSFLGPMPRISPSKHGRQMRDKYQARGARMPVAVVCGGDPMTFLMASSEVPYGVSEYEIVGGVRGKPVEVVNGPVTGLPIPANAEIVLEGFVEPGNERIEGPFGEWTGYYASDLRPEPVLDVKAVYYRNNPILLCCVPQRPPDEICRYRAVVRSALLRENIEKAGVPGVTAAWAHEVGNARLLLAVAVNQRYPGHAKQAGHIAAMCHVGAYCGRYVIVVDDDIDVSNLEEVVWATLTRSDPATSIDIIRNAWSTPLDPRIEPERKAAGDYTNSRAIIDACRPWHWRDKFPKVNVPTPEERRMAQEKFGHLFKD